MKCSGGKDDICRNDVDLGTSQGCSPDEDYCTNVNHQTKQLMEKCRGVVETQRIWVLVLIVPN